jgi:hypothetical protein
MPDAEAGIGWLGQDGVRYNSKTATDSHLRFYHRMLVEKHPELVALLDTAQRTQDPIVPYLLQRIERRVLHISGIANELAARQLTPLLPRTAEQLAIAATRKQIREQQAAAPQQAAVPARENPSLTTLAARVQSLFQQQNQRAQSTATPAPPQGTSEKTREPAVATPPPVPLSTERRIRLPLPPKRRP